MRPRIAWVQEGEMPTSGQAETLRRLNYDVWCQCARLLLGLREHEQAEWPALYCTGLTPLQAARAIGFGNTAADLAVWT
jgi:hypothetical protein